MNAIDTNVLLYRIDRREAAKRMRSRELLHKLVAASTATVLPWQVVTEFARQLRRWELERRITASTLRAYLDTIRSLFPIVMPTPNVLDRALDLTERNGLGHWDAMIVAACLDAGVNALYTEDMGSPRRIESLDLINPFT